MIGIIFTFLNLHLQLLVIEQLYIYLYIKLLDKFKISSKINIYIILICIEKPLIIYIYFLVYNYVMFIYNAKNIYK